MQHPLYTAGVTFIFVAGVLVVPLLWKMPAPYGRHVRHGFGPLMDARAGWILMESVAPLSFAFVFLRSTGDDQPVRYLFLLAWIAHYANRAIVHPLRVRGTGRRMPLATVLAAVAFNLVNGGANGFAVSALAPHLTTAWLGDWRFVSGATLFVTGAAINLQADSTLLRLRRPGENDYRIPRGGLFRFVSCPNYLGEWIEWCGFALASWTAAGAAFAFFTAANLAPRARSHHAWYRATFADYPRKRRALLPFLW